MNNTEPLRGIERASRTPWGDFPNALIHGDIPLVQGHPQYVLIDDFIGQGGTMANLKGYIESNGGRVILATALTGQDYSAKLSLAESTLAALRAKHGDLEDWFKNTFGYGFDRLTESEARYLTRAESVDVIRNRLAQARSQANR